MLHSSQPLNTLLIVAQSGRMLAQMAADAGYQSIVIDCFADADTQALAVQVYRVKSLAWCDVQPVAELLLQYKDVNCVLYGSGLENQPDTLAHLQQHWQILGNSCQAFGVLQNKTHFFSALSALSIPHPETVFTPPQKGQNWLIKPWQGQGGLGVHYFVTKAAYNFAYEDCYWQRYLPGRVMSLTFVATADDFEILGYNRQRTVALGGLPFVFAGVANFAGLSAVNKELLTDWLAKLLRVYRLQGLGSLDFMLVRGKCYVLEINGRIPASAQLYGKSVLTRHINACGGALMTGTPPTTPAAYQILYAHTDTLCPAPDSWPVWVKDKPNFQAIIGKNQPICSIMCAANTPAQVIRQLQRRRKFIEFFLTTGF